MECGAVVCKSQIQLVSLMEILRILAQEFVQKTFHLGVSIDQLMRPNAPSIWSDTEHRASLSQSLDDLGRVCEQAELPVTKIKIEYLTKSIRMFDDPLGKTIADKMPNQMVAHNLHEIRDRLIDELSTKLFLYVPHSRKQLWDNPRDKWESVIERFPDTVLEIEESARCFALSRYAASVFHCIQVVEFGLIELGKFISVSDPKSGWTAVSKRLEQIMKTEHDKLREPERKHFPFLEQINGTVLGLKNAWRNKISHAQGRLVLMTADFSPDVAEEIRMATRAFMRRLAEDLPT